jgi:hypothetical protein
MDIIDVWIKALNNILPFYSDRQTRAVTIFKF